MWRMSYFPNISKLSCFEQNLGPYLEFPILIYTFLLYTLISPKTVGRGCKFLKISTILCYKLELLLSYGQKVANVRIYSPHFWRTKKLLDTAALNGTIKG